MVKIELGKGDFVWIGLLIVLVGVGFSYAYGGGDPSIMGHSAGELDIGNVVAKSVCSGDTFLTGNGACWTAAEIVSAGGGSSSGGGSSGGAVSGGGVITLSSKKCYDGDVYWYNSAGVKGVKAEECGSVNSGCHEGRCSYCRYNFAQCAPDDPCEQIAWMVYGAKTTIYWGEATGPVSQYNEVLSSDKYIKNGYVYFKGELVSQTSTTGKYKVCRQSI